jgi:hypothetical protein
MTKELEPQKDKQVIPAMNQEDLKEMYGDLGSEDVIIPRLVILQGLSPAVSEGQGKPGEFYVTGIQRNLGMEPIEIICIMRNKSRIRWRDLTLGGGILCRSFDSRLGVGDPGGDCETCKFQQWTAMKRPECDIYQNLIIVLRRDNEWMPMALSGNRTKLKVMKNLNTMLMLELSKGRPLCSKSYMLSPKNASNAQGLKYFNYSVSVGNNNQPISDEEQSKAIAIFGSLKGKKIKVDEAPGEDQAETASHDAASLGI